MRATGLVAALALLWGSGYFWIKLALGGFTPIQLTFGRLTLGALALAVVLAARRQSYPRRSETWAHLTVAAFLGCALPYSLFAFAERTTSSSLAGVLNATTPIWTVILALLPHSSYRLSLPRLLGVAIGFGGTIVAAELWAAGPTTSLGGIIACLSAALSYAIAYSYQAQFLVNRGNSTAALTAAQLAIAALMVAILLPFDEPPPNLQNALAWIAVLTLGIAGTGTALIINLTLIADEGAISASVVTFLVPVTAIALGVLVLNEPANWSLPVGAAMILVGVALVRFRRRTTSGHG